MLQSQTKADRRRIRRFAKFDRESSCADVAASSAFWLSCQLRLGFIDHARTADTFFDQSLRTLQCDVIRFQLSLRLLNLAFRIGALSGQRNPFRRGEQGSQCQDRLFLDNGRTSSRNCAVYPVRATFPRRAPRRSRSPRPARRFHRHRSDGEAISATEPPPSRFPAASRRFRSTPLS